MPLLTGDKVHLRPLEPEDAVPLAADENLAEAFAGPWPGRRLVGAAGYRRRFEALTLRPDEVAAAIASREDGRLLGACGLSGLDPLRRSARLWYGLLREEWGRGYASEGCRLLLDYAFDRLALHRVWTVVVENDTRSRRVAERLSFRRAGRLREAVPHSGAWHDELVYDLLEDEWRGLRSRRPLPGL